MQKAQTIKYWTKSKGAGGHIKDEEDFVVQELPLRKFLSTYTRDRGGVKQIDGPYVLALLKKKSMTTKSAIRLIRNGLGINKNDIGYAGLKDKFAVTSQYITIRKEKFREIKSDNLELTRASFTNNMMQVGELEGNKFVIALHDCKHTENVEDTIEELKRRGLPNYFGPQRFGKNNDNHVIGRLILQRKYEEALKLINEQLRKNHKSLQNIDKSLLKFFIHAYQSFIFNRVLDSYISKNQRPCFDNFCIVGFDTKLGNFSGKETKKLLEKDGIKQDSFAIRELNIKCEGSSRYAFVLPKILAYSINGKTLALEFELPKGSYATVLIGEVTKI